MTNWTDIHPDFDKKGHSQSNKTYQEQWEESGFTKSDTKLWIEIGFEPHEHDIVKKWKRFGFAPHRARAWIRFGCKKREHEFVNWLVMTKNCSPHLARTKLEQLRIEYESLRIENSQDWLEEVYVDHNIKKLNISSKRLTGTLNLSQYTQLEELNCSFNILVGLDLRNCCQLKELNCCWNKLVDLNLSGCSQLRKIDCSHNPINRNLYCFYSLDNLEELYLNDTNFFGSLSPLINLKKLKYQNFSNNNLESDIEFLPDELYLLSAENITKIKERLEKFVISTGYYNYYEWRGVNRGLVTKIRDNGVIKKNIKILYILNTIKEKDIPSEKNRKVLDVLIFNLEQEIIDVKKEIYEQNNYQAQQVQAVKQAIN